MAKFQTKAFTNVKPIILPRDASVMLVPVDVEFKATTYAIGDLIEICELPIGVKCVDWAISFPDIDSNAAPTLAYSLGIENVGGTDLGTEVWGAALTAGQSTAIVRNASSVSAQGDTTAVRKLALKVTTAAATYAGAGKTGQILLALQA